MFPKPCQRYEGLFSSLVEPNQFETHIWDIEPLCQVAGLGEDDETILDGCRGVSIRWKAFPRMKYKRNPGFRMFVGEIILRSDAYWSALGLALIIKRAYDLKLRPDTNGDEADMNVLLDQGLIALAALALLLAFVLTGCSYRRALVVWRLDRGNSPLAGRLRGRHAHHTT